MIVGVLEVEIAVLEAQSLKDKRRVVKSLKDRIRNRFNVSIAEVRHADTIRRCGLGVAMVSGSQRPMHGQFDRIVDLIRRTPAATLLAYDRAFF